MDIIESAISVEKCTALVKARISRRLSVQPAIRVRAFAAADTSSPTKELDAVVLANTLVGYCLLYTSPSPRDLSTSRMPSSA